METYWEKPFPMPPGLPTAPAGKELFCFHHWSPWFEPMSEKGRWRMCNGLCKSVSHEGDPEPKVVVAVFG